MMTPAEIVQALNKHIVGQEAAKRAVAIALRNRYRRMQVDETLRNEITPKNILMIGPTGVGKTEIARRLAKLAEAPFIKVEATKFTEVGYVGRDVESIIRDLADISYKMTKEAAIAKLKIRVEETALERIAEVLVAQSVDADTDGSATEELAASKDSLYEKLLAGDFDEDEIELEVSIPSMDVDIIAPPGMEAMTNQLQGMFQNLAGTRTRVRKMRIKDALKIVREEEASKLINDDEIRADAIVRAEQHGIVFLDEIDKVTQRNSQGNGPDVSREGVQRDLLPLVEGCTVSTKYGMIKTDHILFIASGAFHLTKPSDLIPELQGRLPLRVELHPLKAEEFVRILTEPRASLTEQYKALLATEETHITFDPSAIECIAQFAWEINEGTENIGARRLHTVMERLLEKLSFEAGEKPQTLCIDKAYVTAQLGDLVKNPDLSHFIL